MKKSAQRGIKFIFAFGNIRERDIDMLLMNGFATDTQFLQLFIEKIDRPELSKASVCSVELSKTDPVYGESDVTVIFEAANSKYAFLIEDKVGADAQPDQCGRYFKRGDVGIDLGEYEEFFVFICAASEYIAGNEEAKLYPFSMSFEELSGYFSQKTDTFSQVQHELLQQALSFSKTPYNKIVDAVATEFWKDFVEYQVRHYPQLLLKTQTMKKSRDGDWPVYNTILNCRRKLYIHQKTNLGYIDLTFRGMANRQQELMEFLHRQIGNYEGQGLFICAAGKSAVLRKNLGPDATLSYQKPFLEQKEIVEKHLEAINLLHNIAGKLTREELIALLDSPVM